MYTYKVEQAIRAACILHQDQLRKGSVPIPYISHLMAVTLTVADYTRDENILAAAMLHDTLEDTDYTDEEMTDDFGGHVTELVRPLTEPTHHGNTKYTWIERKKAYANQLKQAPEGALIIAAADKAHHYRSVIDEYHDDIPRFYKDFGNRNDERLEAHTAISNVLNSRLKNDIVHEFNHTFKEFKEFLQNAQKYNQPH